MTEQEIAAVLAEEIRTNVRLRREMGMSEGAESGKVDDEPAVGILTDDGFPFFITVQKG